MKIKHTPILLFVIVSGMLLSFLPSAKNGLSGDSFTTFEIKPSETDKTITNADEPHLVVYNRNAKQANLLVFMPGTGGIASRGPADFLIR